MTNIATNGSISIDGVSYSLGDLSDSAKVNAEGILFSDRRIEQLQNQLAISNTARAGYLRVLTAGLKGSKACD